MAVDLLDAPLRVSWDLCGPENPLNEKQILLLAQRLIDAGVFYVSLESEPLTHPSIIPLLESLLAGGCQASLVLHGDASELSLLELLPAAVTLYVDCAAFICAGKINHEGLRQRLTSLRDAQRKPSLLWVPRRGELPILLDLLHFCAADSIGCFKLPNQKISANSDLSPSSFLPDCNDLEQLAGVIVSTGLPKIPNLHLEVHDLFLWELLQPLSGGQRSEYGGCQAANSLGHIDAIGALLPCASWPEPLGSLLDDDLYHLWQSAQRLTLCEQIKQVPVGCENCRDYQICFGGCRGLANFCRNDGVKRDLLCSARR